MNINFNTAYYLWHILVKSKRNERLYESLFYLYLPFVMNEHWSEIAWCRAKDAKEIQAARLAFWILC